MNEDRVALMFGLLCAGSVVIVLIGLGAMIYAILTSDTGRKAPKRAIEERAAEERPVEGRWEIEERGRLRARRIEEMRRPRRRRED